MRIPVLMILVIGMVWAAKPAGAQAYDPHYPVCMHVVGLGSSYYDCSFTSLAQCSASASGRSAQCDANPFYGGGALARSDRRYHPAY
jgi:hypothetical protein